MNVRVGPVWLRLRADAQARWRAWIGLALLAGVAGGLTIAAFAGARRTETAYERFLDATNPFDALVSNGGTTSDNLNRQFDFDELARHPQVVEAAPLSYYFAQGRTDSGPELNAGDISLFAPSDGRFGRDLNRFEVARGRLARAETEVVITLLAAEQFDLDVGDVLHLHLYGPDAMARAYARGGDAAVAALADDGPTEAFTVVGVVATQGGFPPATGGIGATSYLSQEYARTHPDAAQVLAVRLGEGPDAGVTFESELARLGQGAPVAVVSGTDQSSVVQRGFDVQAAALRVFGVLAAVTTALVVAQALGRQAALDAEERGVLRALGMGRSELAAAGVVRAVVLSVAAGVLAFVVAIGASALTPLGAARDAELHPGIAFNRAWVGGGALVVAAVVMAFGTAAALWSTRKSVDAADPTEGSAARWIGSVVASSGSAPAVVGTRLALRPGRGRSAVPVRSTLVGATIGVAVLAVVLTFSASLAHLFHRPALYGWNWDVQIGDSFTPELGGAVQELASDPAVEALAAGTVVRLDLGGLRVNTLGTESVRGAIEPIVVDGRAPVGPDEILIGTLTLQDLDLDVGETVVVGFGDRTTQMRIVGRGVLSEFADGVRLGEGAAVTLAGMRELVPGVEPNVALLRFAAGARPPPLIDKLDRRLGGSRVYTPRKPSDLEDLERVGGLPFVVASLLALMGLATLAHSLFMSVRRRRRELATLAALGFGRTETSRAVAWQATMIAAIAVALGIPLGIVAGRWAWDVFADRLGVPSRPATPVLALIVLTIAAVVLANVVAIVPARLAARTRASSVLRTE